MHFSCSTELALSCFWRHLFVDSLNRYHLSISSSMNMHLITGCGWVLPALGNKHFSVKLHICLSDIAACRYNVCPLEWVKGRKIIKILKIVDWGNLELTLKLLFCIYFPVVIFLIGLLYLALYFRPDNFFCFFVDRELPHPLFCWELSRRKGNRRCSSRHKDGWWLPELLINIHFCATSWLLPPWYVHLSFKLYRFVLLWGQFWCTLCCSCNKEIRSRFQNWLDMRMSYWEMACIHWEKSLFLVCLQLQDVLKAPVRYGAAAMAERNWLIHIEEIDDWKNIICSLLK